MEIHRGWIAHGRSIWFRCLFPLRNRKGIEAGLIERAELLNKVLADFMAPGPWCMRQDFRRLCFMAIPVSCGLAMA